MKKFTLKKIFFNKKNTQYNIDHVLPTKIIGWISSKDTDFDEIILSCKNAIISKSKINIERNDVYKKFGFKSNVGFILDLPKTKPTFRTYRLKITAYSKEKKIKFNLKINQNKYFDKTSSKLKDLLSSEILGLDGHFNGKNYGSENLNGWITSFSKNSPTIWLNLLNNQPIAVKCSRNYRKFDSLKKIYYYDYYFNVEDIPISYSGEVWFTFDQEGKYKIPQSNLVNIDTVDINSTVVNLERKEPLTEFNYFEQKKRSSTGIQEYWDEIISNEEFLDTLNNFIKINEKKNIHRKNLYYYQTIKKTF